MSKLNMDKDTILFIDSKNDKALGMNYKFYSEHYNEISPDHKISNPDLVLYKTGDTFDSWINFQRAVNTKKGTLKSRIAQAFEDMTYRITDLKVIPQTIYYDEEGYMWEISPYDGCSESTYWIPRSDNMDLRQGYDFDIDDSGKHVYITFHYPLDVDNALISINGIFYNYRVMERGERPVILVPDLVSKLSVDRVNFSKLTDEELEGTLNTLSDQIKTEQSILLSHLNSNLELDVELKKLNDKLKEDDFNSNEIRAEISSVENKIASNNTIIRKYNAQIQEKTDRYNNLYNQGIRYFYHAIVKAYTWENVKKDILTSPKKVADEWFETVSNVTDNCIIIYNGVIMDFEVNPINSHQFRFTNVTLPAMKIMNLSKIRIFKFSHMDPNKGVRKCVIRGHNNIHKNTVDFVLPVHQSLIVYEGVDHQYDVVESATIIYSTDVNYVDDSAVVQSINFTPAG